ncbi:hypothetical protein HHI36_012518 [Cryptolaemus montrouzieri]|uniref:ditrans,polycis-polyprenyl diphosphate synthase [(2E,6E)-farnesyldiphosphate specific] n=1 Tax=Cryptolaemus montrouzieri TaxID=559131 RepID=A0ABD2NFX8_9CUCU
MYRILNKIVYVAFYYVYIFFEFLYDKSKSVKEHFSSLKRNITPLVTVEKNGFQNLTKRPNHITFIIDESPSYVDLANLVIWCMTARISFVSFYDHRGILKKHEEKLEQEVNKRKQTTDHIFWHNNRNSDFKNGFSGRKVHVKILTGEDGKKNVQSVCKQIISKNKPYSEITIDYVNEYLREQYEFPDPDVGIIFSKIFMLFNYPPWQIRLTEFHRLKSHYNISFNDFVDVLIKFSKCNQRIGT